MKALSVRQPWAYLIVSGIKRIENRDWTTDYRGPLLIHASMSWHAAAADRDEFQQRYRVKIPNELPQGAIVGCVLLIDVITHSRDRFFTGPYGFVLAKPQMLDPIPMLGRSRLFDVDADPSISARASSRD